MHEYGDRSLRVKARLAGVLEMSEPLIGSHFHTTPGSVAAAFADFAFLRRPKTQQGIEMLCEIVLIVQDHPVTRSRASEYMIGGTYETGWPIDPVERLGDCIAAAADLGMFDPVPALTPEQGASDLLGGTSRLRVLRPLGSEGVAEKRDVETWPIMETLPDGAESEFSPVGGQWIPTRRFAYNRFQSVRSGPSLSAHAQFLWDLNQFLTIIVDRLFEAIRSSEPWE